MRESASNITFAAYSYRTRSPEELKKPLLPGSWVKRDPHNLLEAKAQVTLEGSLSCRGAAVVCVEDEGSDAGGESSVPLPVQTPTMGVSRPDALLRHAACLVTNGRCV